MGDYLQGPGLPATVGPSAFRPGEVLSSLCFGSAGGLGKGRASSVPWLSDTPAAVSGNVFLHPRGKWMIEKGGERLGWALQTRAY